MRLKLPPALFPYNKLKEVYYTSFLIKKDAEKFFEQINDAVFAPAKAEIKLMEVPWGCNRNAMIGRLGNPRFIIKPHDDRDRQVLFYKQEISAERSVIQYHFLKDQYCYAHVDFISSLSSQNKNIPQLLEKKYGVKDLSSGKPVMIKDAYDNKIMVEADVYLRLDYISGKQKFLSAIERRTAVKGKHTGSLTGVERCFSI